MNLVSLYYKMAYKPKMEADWFFTVPVGKLSLGLKQLWWG